MKYIARRHLANGIILLTLFILVTVFFSTQSYLDYFLKGAPIDFRTLLLWNTVRWLPWVILAPLVIRFGKRFQLFRAGWLHTLPIHIGACLACALIHSLLYHALCVSIEKTFHPFDIVLITGKSLHSNILTYGAILIMSHTINSQSNHPSQR